MGTGCPACSISYNPSKIGYLYILHYSDGDQDWLKCGITNDPELRFQRLSSSALKLGIETNEIDIYRFDDGAIPKNCERSCSKWLKLDLTLIMILRVKMSFSSMRPLKQLESL